MWDLGGQTSIRPYWRCYYPNTQAIIYVVDSSDTERVGTSREEFHAVLQEEELKDALLLVYANKQVIALPIEAVMCSDGSLLGAATVLVDLLHSFCQQLSGYNLAQDTMVGLSKSFCI